MIILDNAPIFGVRGIQSYHNKVDEAKDLSETRDWSATV